MGRNNYTQQEIAVYAAHIKSGGAKDKDKKEYQANAVAENINALRHKRNNIPIIFGADFNCHFEATPEELYKKFDGSTPLAVFHDTLNKVPYKARKPTLLKEVWVSAKTLPEGWKETIPEGTDKPVYQCYVTAADGEIVPSGEETPKRPKGGKTFYYLEAGLTKERPKPEPPIVNADGNEEPATGNPPSATYSTSHCYDNKDYWYPEHPHESFMASAYKQVLGEEPDYTKAGWRKAGEQTQKIENGKEWRETVGKAFKDALFKAETEDYIHFSSDYFAATSVMSIPSYEALDKAILLSDWKQPSDHFQIQADLEYGTMRSIAKSFGSIPLTPQERELLAEWKEHFGQDGNIPNATQFRKYATSVGKGIKYKRISALFKARDALRQPPIGPARVL